MTLLLSEVYDWNFTVGKDVLTCLGDVYKYNGNNDVDMIIGGKIDLIIGCTSENALVFYFYEDVYEDVSIQLLAMKMNYYS